MPSDGPQSRTPAIAVVMPVYNRASTVRAAIDSIISQTFEDFELVVVDDGSSDGSADVVESVRDPRVTLIRMPANAGGNAARNRGIDASSAPIVTFLDSDDLYLPHKLGFLVDYFDEHRGIDVLLDSFVKSYRPERDRPDVELRNPVLSDNDEILTALFTRRIWKATPGIAARRETILKAGKFDEALRRRQDFDFILRLASVGRCATTDRILWSKTYSSSAISGDLRSFVPSTLAFYERHPEYYSNPVYREGFAHDLGRHFRRLLKRRRFAAMLSDAVPLARALGPVRFLTLTSRGAGLFRARRRQLRDL